MLSDAFICQTHPKLSTLTFSAKTDVILAKVWHAATLPWLPSLKLTQTNQTRPLQAQAVIIPRCPCPRVWPRWLSSSTNCTGETMSVEPYVTSCGRKRRICAMKTCQSLKRRPADRNSAPSLASSDAPHNSHHPPPWFWGMQGSVKQQHRQSC